MDFAALNREGKMFSAANVSSKNFIAVTTAMTGLLLYNPLGSGKNLLIADIGFVWVTAPAAVHNLGVGFYFTGAAVPTSLTAIGSGVLAADGSGGRGDSVASAYDAATLAAAPVVQRWIGGAVYGSGVGESPYSILDKVDGALMVKPGSVLALAAVTTTLAGMAHITWAELPVNP